MGLAACLPWAAAPTAAGAPQTGGAEAPPAGAEATRSQLPRSARITGGSEYGVRAAASIRRPVVTQLNVPTVASPGVPPRVTVRIDEPGVGTVLVGVTIHDLSTRRAVVVASLGWVRVGRLLAVPWPRGARLSPGAYHVSVTARDHNSGSLLRRAHSSGVATLTVPAPAPAPVPAPVLQPPIGSGPVPAGVLTPAQSAALGAAFPVAGPHSFGGPENRFGAARSSHVHQGQDILAAEGTAIVAPLDGVVLKTGYQAGGAGYYLVLHTAHGLDFMFAHCMSGSLLVSSGQAVATGQPLTQVGQTGSATTPHLHFEIWVGGWQAPEGQPIDPLPYLQAWDHA
jgi:murein DD-endopeptidase MepM/ murein hydrolase activator NlpD